MPDLTAAHPTENRPRRIREGRLSRIGAPVALVVFAILAGFPLYWMIVQALQPESMRFAFPPPLFPSEPTLDGFARAFTGNDVITWLINSFIVAATSAVLTLVIGAWGAYAISRFRTRGTTIVSFLVLATQMIPPVVLMIPLYKAFVDISLVGSLSSLIVANFIFNLPVAVWMMKSVFDSVPEEIEEAARVDGCNRFSVLFRVTIPLAAPGVLATGIFAFIAAWEEYLFARVLISDPAAWTGSIGIASFFGEFGTAWNQVMATSLIFTIPPIMLFLIVQRRFVEGMSGGLKG